MSNMLAGQLNRCLIQSWYVLEVARSAVVMVYKLIEPYAGTREFSVCLFRPLSFISLGANQCILRRFRFTTIDPQRAIGYLQVDCACSRYNLQDRCKPNYGGCHEGRRSVPIELLDVAGLVPGAHEGKGLGNKFLDDLRHADALIHVVDVSGTTDAEGRRLVLWDN
ncbi:hypothetical protein H106_08697 [Trichophyton rubrum CBS 735.88]|nr:hypothetical protein H106_08697 [Trichophyton rubrum CBS 735.88]